MFSPRRYIAIARKEYLELKRNKLFFMMTILAPIILYFLFAFAFSLDARNIPIGVVDLDKSQLSRSLIDAFATATDLFRVKMVGSDYKHLEKQMDLERLRVVLFIPHDFSHDIKKGKYVKLQVMIDGVNPVYSNVVSSYVNAILASFQTGILVDYFSKRYGSSGLFYMPIDLEVSAWYNSSFRSEDFIIPGVIAIIIMFFPPIVGAISLAREKETGSILNMYCSSVTKTEYLLGKMTPYVLISYANCILFIFLSILLFKVPMRGNFLYLAVISLFYVSSSIAIGLLVAVLVNTQIAAILIASILTLTPSFMYSGFMVPLSSLKAGAKTYSYSSPATYYIDLIRKVMVKGATFINIKDDFFTLICFAFGLYFISIKLFKKRLG